MPRRAFFGMAALGLLATAAARVSTALGWRPVVDSDASPILPGNDRRGNPTVSYFYDELARVVAVVDATEPSCHTIEYALEPPPCGPREIETFAEF